MLASTWVLFTLLTTVDTSTGIVTSTPASFNMESKEVCIANKIEIQQLSIIAGEVVIGNTAVCTRHDVRGHNI